MEKQKTQKGFWDKGILNKIFKPAYMEEEFDEQVSECKNCKRRTSPREAYVGNINFCRKHQKQFQELRKEVGKLEKENMRLWELGQRKTKLN